MTAHHRAPQRNSIMMLLPFMPFQLTPTVHSHPDRSFENLLPIRGYLVQCDPGHHIRRECLQIDLNHGLVLTRPDVPGSENGIFLATRRPHSPLPARDPPANPPDKSVQTSHSQPRPHILILLCQLLSPIIGSSIRFSLPCALCGLRTVHSFLLSIDWRAN